ncbi:MAG: fibrillarin-like rRNA/tRNA 2'-O-methyltransferase [Candidatus Helarchaeota archaeon]|nr:fibrillarin-like rRNA/tRNA 2'-O-methyltransferase [Candidatus Helarchaeota archaeon]
MKEKLKSHEKFPGIYWITLEDEIDRLATKNFTPGNNVYGERLISINGVEYRLWTARRSKLAAGILKNLKTLPIKPNTEDKLLYLGSASGTTASHISDIMGAGGTIYCLEFAQRVMREFVEHCKVRSNLIPIFGDARFPEKYSPLMDQVDLIYCDIAQPEQAQILANNANWFLKDGGFSLLCVKSRSVDVTKKPEVIYKKQISILKKNNFEIIEVLKLDPYTSDHALVSAKFNPK